MPKFVALIQTRRNFGDRHFVKSSSDETKEQFIKRMEDCYGGDNVYEIEIYQLGEKVK